MLEFGSGPHNTLALHSHAPEHGRNQAEPLGPVTYSQTEPYNVKNCSASQQGAYFFTGKSLSLLQRVNLFCGFSMLQSTLCNCFMVVFAQVRDTRAMAGKNGSKGQNKNGGQGPRGVAGSGRAASGRAQLLSGR